MTDKNELIIQIAKDISREGGRTFYVGGCVRDRLLGREPGDTDIEVHGILPEKLRAILEKHGELLSFGSSFGIYSLKGLDVDIAMPRKERVTGRGHRDFEIEIDPFIGTEKAAVRRDFTINAMMMDVLTGEITDHFGGRRDLETGVIRHVNDVSFREDSLRVLRAAQFAARFGFRVDPETVELCRTMDLSDLSRERVEGELRKALLTAPSPSVFFRVLREMDQLLPWFREISELIGIEQDPVFHPEGDVWNHTMEVLDRGAALRDEAEDPYGFMMLCLTHDLGKTVTTTFEKGRIHAYGHETEGLPLAEALVSRLTGQNSVLNYVMNMVPLHMKPNMVAYSKSRPKVTNKMFDEAVCPRDLILFAEADRPVMAGDTAFTGDREFLKERYETYLEVMSHDEVTGQDLIDSGLVPGEDFREILGYAHKLKLAGISREDALKQVISYGKKIQKQ